MTIQKTTAILLALVTLSACTATKVRPTTAENRLKHVCIKKNSAVIVDDFLNVVREGFERHNITTKIYESDPPSSCENIVTYTANQSWDVVPFLTHAEIRVEKDGRQIAYTEYHLRGRGMYFYPNKWRSLRTKMDPLIDEMLSTKS